MSLSILTQAHTTLEIPGNNTPVLPQQYFGYDTLPKEGSIRLLKLLDMEDEMPSCILATQKLDNKPIYNALSYTWGPPSFQMKESGVTNRRLYPIKCNGQTIMVTRNLNDFFLQAYKSHQELLSDYLWIDAICINQENLEERANQVGMMTDIYTTAKTVIVWLGEEDSSTTLAFDLLDKFRASLPNQPDNLLLEAKETKEQADSPVLEVEKVKEQPDSLLLEAKENKEQPETEKEQPEADKELSKAEKDLSLLLDPQANREALESLMGRKWFSRAWVIQEVLVAKEIVPYCGSRRLSWFTLVEMSQALFSRAAKSGIDVFATGTVSNAYMLFVNRASRKKFSQNRLWLYDCLMTFSGFEASEPSDKIYALLGLVETFPKTSTGLPPLQPNYSRPVVDLYTYVTRAFIDDSPKYLALLAVQNLDPQAVPGLPSWVPNYNASRYTLAGLSAPNLSIGSLEQEIRHFSDCSLLGLNGAQLGTVDGVADSLDPSNPTRAIPQWVELLCRHCHLGNLPQIENLWRSLIENRLGLGKAPDNFGICFANWLLFEIAKEFWETSQKNTESSDPAKHVIQDMKAIHHLKRFEPDDPKDPNHLLGLPDEEMIRYFAVIYAVQNSTPDAEKLLQNHDLEDALLVSNRRSCAEEYKTALLPFEGRRIFSTDNGLFGQGPPSMRVGDTVWIIPGLNIPIILRNLEEGIYNIIGDAFIYEHMDGEDLRDENLSLKEIVLS